MNVNQQLCPPQQLQQSSGDGPREVPSPMQQEAGSGPRQIPQQPAPPNQPRIYFPSNRTANGSAGNDAPEEPAGTPIFEGFTSLQENTLSKAFSHTKRMVHSALEKLKTSPPDVNYEMNFGEPTPENIKEVERVLTNMDKSMAHDQYTFKAAEPSSQVPENFEAYVNTHDSDHPHEIYVTPKFWNHAPETNYTEEVIAHEISHFKDIGGTEDRAYGPMESWLLAPSDALRNADSYGMFVQHQPTA